MRSQGLTYRSTPSFPFSYPSGWKYNQIVKSWRLDEWRDYLEKESFDLVIIDMELHEWILALQLTKIPYVLLSQWFPIWPNDHAPCPQSLAYPSTEKEHKRSWSNLRMRRRWRNWTTNRFGLKWTRQRALRRYIKENGIDPDLVDHHGWPPPMIHLNTPTWTLTNQSLDFEGNARDLDVFLGAHIDLDRYEMPEEETRVWLDRIVQLNKRKLILCTLSTMNSSPTSHLARIIEAVSTRPDWELWITTGGKSDMDSSALPDNVQVFDWIPQIWVLWHAAVSIHHGGIHTINECLIHKVPQLVYSGGRHDQNGCAARVGYHGIGILGNKANDQPDRIREYIESLMSDEKYTQALEHHYAKFEELNSNQRFESIVNSALNSNKS